jgi:hypothetical protein
MEGNGEIGETVAEETKNAKLLALLNLLQKWKITVDMAERGGFEPPLGCLFPKTV